MLKFELYLYLKAGVLETGVLEAGVLLTTGVLEAGVLETGISLELTVSLETGSTDTTLATELELTVFSTFLCLLAKGIIAKAITSAKITATTL